MEYFWGHDKLSSDIAYIHHIGSVGYYSMAKMVYVYRTAYYTLTNYTQQTPGNTRTTFLIQLIFSGSSDASIRIRHIGTSTERTVGLSGMRYSIKVGS